MYLFAFSRLFYFFVFSQYLRIVDIDLLRYYWQHTNLHCYFLNICYIAFVAHCNFPSLHSLLLDDTICRFRLNRIRHVSLYLNALTYTLNRQGVLISLSRSEPVPCWSSVMVLLCG